MEQPRLPGVTTTSARAGQSARVVPEHGTRARYLHRSLACRCAACTRANTDYHRTHRAELARANTWAPRPVQLHLPASCWEPLR